MELVFREWSRDGEGVRIRAGRFTCVLDPDCARWLAITLNTDGEARTLTAADPGFEPGWGDTGPRRLADSGRYQPLADGSSRITEAPDAGAGAYRVRIGLRLFICLRVIDPRAADESEEAGVAFVERPNGPVPAIPRARHQRRLARMAGRAHSQADGPDVDEPADQT